MNFSAAMKALEEAAVAIERQVISDEARRYASHYPLHSDGRNTFLMLADWIDARGRLTEGQQVKS